MLVDPSVEEPTRKMLGNAIRGELTELEAMVEAIGAERYMAGVALCLAAAGYIAVDLSRRWPTEADVREISRHSATTSTMYQLREEDVYNFVFLGALSFKPVDKVFPDPKADYLLPILITAQLLIAFRLGDGKQWWEYLDKVWDSIEAAEGTDISLLPALMLRAQRTWAAAGK
jgi:hypothetical protein